MIIEETLKEEGKEQFHIILDEDMEEKPKIIQRIETARIFWCVIVGDDNTLYMGEGVLGRNGGLCGISIYKYNENKELVLKAQLRGHSNHVLTLALDYYNNFLYSGSADTTIKKWDLKSYACVKTIIAHQKSTSKLTVLSDERVVSCSKDLTIKIWTKDLELTKTLNGHTGPIRHLVELSDGNLLSSSQDLTTKIWNLRTYECITVFSGIEVFALTNSLYYNEEEEKIIIGGRKGIFSIINLKLLSTERIFQSTHISTRSVNNIIMLNDKNFLIGLSWEENQLLLYDHDLKYIKNINYPYRDYLMSTVHLYDCQQFVTVDGGGNIVLWEY